MKTSIVLLLCISVFPGFSQGRVVREDETGFAECNVFFPGQVPPEGFTEPFHVKICQQYNKEPRFATLYSTKDKIPLYSAFKFTKPAQSEEENWLVEPQVRQLFLCCTATVPGEHFLWGEAGATILLRRQEPCLLNFSWHEFSMSRTYFCAWN